MALDEPHDDDERLDDRGVTYLINKQLYEQVKPINVDFVDMAMGTGFAINSNLKKDNACGGSCCG